MKKNKGIIEELNDLIKIENKEKRKIAKQILDLLITSARNGEFDSGIGGYIVDTYNKGKDKGIEAKMVKDIYLSDFRAAIVDFLESRKIELEEVSK
jgi:hypothetical protein